MQQIPLFPGGNEALATYLRKHVQRPAGKRLSGKVLVTFKVLHSGDVRGAYVKPGNGLDPRYDAAAVEVISSLRGFQGGKTNGQPSDIEVNYQVVFR